jgi:hypothetical protein
VFQTQKLTQELAEREHFLQICKDELAAGQEKHDDLLDQIEKLTDSNKSLEAKLALSQEESSEIAGRFEVIHVDASAAGKFGTTISLNRFGWQIELNRLYSPNHKAVGFYWIRAPKSEQLSFFWLPRWRRP